MVIDLTHTLQDNITVYPGTPPAAFPVLSTIEKDGFAEKAIRITTHTGTHIDAPAHILPGSKSLDQFPLEKFMGKGIVVDCTKTNIITLRFLQSLAHTIRNIPFILFYTGWQHKWNTPQYFEPFPTLTTEAVEWLLSFQPKALGFDAISVDSITDEALPNHHLLLRKEVLIIENLTNLDKLTGKDFQLFCIPLPIKSADASPVRAFALIDN
jgi:arylformamidase